MYAASGLKTPDLSKPPRWMQNYESEGGPTDGMMGKPNLLRSDMVPEPEKTKKKAGRF